MKYHSVLVVLLIGLLTFFSGCGQAKKESVSGTVSFEGKPVVVGAIFFLPE